MTCALLAVAKDEDIFLDEWINYHLSLGFDHIYICDNNDKSNKLRIDNDKVTIYDFNNMDFITMGIYKSQCHCYNEVLNDIWDKYDYCGVCDIDEFFTFKNTNLHDFIKKNEDDGYNVMEISWVVYDDNDLIHHIDKPVQELYTRECKKMKFEWCKNECSWGKSIFKLCEGIKINPHWPEAESMTPLGGLKTIHVDTNDAIIKHYRTKCLEDYISHKVMHQNFKHSSCVAKFNGGDIIKVYFDFNDVTVEKLLYSIYYCNMFNIELTDGDKKFILEKFNECPPITVVVRTHNRLNYLIKCIQCLRQQTVVPNILVLDDNSNDGTSQWISTQPYLCSIRTNINVGPGEILMRGRHMITTPYYIILDDDDTWHHNHVIEDFCKEIIKDCTYDIYGDGFLHINYLVRTELLQQCPMTSAWASDDWYWCWIENHGTMNRDVDIKNFYNYTNHHDDFRASQYNGVIRYSLKRHYKEEETDNILKDIESVYHKGDLKDRKVLDQIKKYLEDR